MDDPCPDSSGTEFAEPVSAERVSGGSVSGRSVSGGSVAGGSVAGGRVFGDPVSNGPVSGEAVSDGSVSGEPVVNRVLGCRFCRENDLLADAPLVVTSRFYVLASRDPKLMEAVMIIPHQHHADPFTVSSQEWGNMPEALEAAKAWLGRFDPVGYTLGWNAGQVAGQTVEHVHLHVIARRDGDDAAGHGLRGLLKDKLGR